MTELAGLLIDAVTGGASVGFAWPLAGDEAREYWLEVAEAVESGRYVLLVAGDPVVGTVQLHFSSYPNGRYRAELAKLLVRSAARNRGLGTRLLHAAEQAAIRRGRSLLVLDTETGSSAEHLYRKLGWTRVGEIPDFALTPSGESTATTLFYKRIQ